MLKSSLNLFVLARTPGNKGPTTSGLSLWFACRPFDRGSVRLCYRASYGLCAVYGSLDAIC